MTKVPSIYYISMFLAFLDPTQPPYQQTSAFINIHPGHQIFWQPTHQFLFALRFPKIMLILFCLILFLLTSAFCQPHPSTMSTNISIWSPPPTHLLADVIYGWSLTRVRLGMIFFTIFCQRVNDGKWRTSIN